MKIIVADDQAAVRSALRLLLEQEARLACCIEAESAAEVLDLVKTPSDLLLLDWELPGLDMAELLPALRAAQPDMQIIALSGRPEARREAAALGVSTFVSKSDPPECVLAAIIAS
jgi:DNA-binding NarL/FixJ family response regulator